jgi:hypothetical protein
MPTTNDGPAIYEWTGPTGVKFKQIRHPTGTYFHHDTPSAVATALENARLLGKRIRIWLGDSVTGKSWLEEYDVTGTVGRSMGPIKIPLLMPSPHSRGGGAISDHSIVRLMVDGREVYRHPKFNQPVFTIGPGWSDEAHAPKNRMYKPRSVGVYADGEPCCGFDSESKARRWVDFMEGRRMSK